MTDLNADVAIYNHDKIMKRNLVRTLECHKQFLKNVYCRYEKVRRIPYLTTQVDNHLKNKRRRMSHFCIPT